MAPGHCFFLDETKYCVTPDCFRHLREVYTPLPGYADHLRHLQRFSDVCICVYICSNPCRGLQFPGSSQPQHRFADFVEMCTSPTTSAEVCIPMWRFTDHCRSAYIQSSCMEIRTLFAKSFEEVSCALYLREICVSMRFMCDSVREQLIHNCVHTPAVVCTTPEVCIPLASLFVYNVSNRYMCMHFSVCVCMSVFYKETEFLVSPYTPF